MEHIESKNSSGLKLQVNSTCSMRSRSINQVIAENAYNLI